MQDPGMSPVLYFPRHRCSTPARFTFRLLPPPARGPHLKPCLPPLDLGWTFPVSEHGVDSTPAFNACQTAKPNPARRISYYKGRNSFWLKSLKSNRSLFFKEKQGKKPNPFVAPKSSPGISDQHTCCYNYDWTAWLRHRGMLNRHTGTHQNICELPKWNWHHGSGLYHTSEKGFGTQIKQFNSSAACLESDPVLGCLFLFHMAVSCGFQPVHFILQAQKLRRIDLATTSMRDLKENRVRLARQTPDSNSSIFPLRQKQHRHYQDGTWEFCSF